MNALDEWKERRKKPVKITESRAYYILDGFQIHRTANLGAGQAIKGNLVICPSCGQENQQPGHGQTVACVGKGCTVRLTVWGNSLEVHIDP